MDESIKKEVEYHHSEDNKIVKVTTISPIIKREFEGIWIPKEIWLNKNLNILEKCLLAEIKSLDGKKGCFASNSYFAKFFGVKEQNISKHITKLKKLGYVKQIKFDGRTRFLKVDLMKTLRQDNTNHLSSFNENNVQYNKDYNINNNILSKDNKISSNELINDFKKQSKSIKKEKPKLSFKSSKQITKDCLNMFYNTYKKIHPKIKKETFYAEEKIFECEKLINYYIKGFPLTGFNDLRQFAEKNKDSFNLYSALNFLDENSFKYYFEIALNIYKSNYNPVNKEILPKHLKEFLYNYFGEFKSYFLYYAFNPVEMIQSDNKHKNKYPEYTKKFSDLLRIEINEDLICFVNRLVNENKKIRNNSIKGYTRDQLTPDDINNYTYNFYIRNIDNFIQEYLYWLDEKTDNENFRFEYKFFDSYMKEFSKWFFNRHDGTTLNPAESTMQEKLKELLKK